MFRFPTKNSMFYFLQKQLDHILNIRRKAQKTSALSLLIQ